MRKCLSTSNIIRFIVVLVFVILVFALIPGASALEASSCGEDMFKEDTREVIGDKIKKEYAIVLPETNEELNVAESTNISNLGGVISRCETQMQYAHEMAESARKLGYLENSIIILSAKHIWENQHNLYLSYFERLNALEARQRKIEEEKELEWIQKRAEYPDATYVWEYLKESGYNDYVCAGIIGNMMVECGGMTLGLQSTIWGNGFYGICQWGQYYPGVFNCSLEEQCDFLLSNIEYELNTFGSCYKKNFDYESFMNITDERDAAEAFAKCYERCGNSYSYRMDCAEIALEYFTA